MYNNRPIKLQIAQGSIEIGHKWQMMNNQTQSSSNSIY